MKLIEISPRQYQLITPLIREYADYPVVNAVIEGNSPGRIFVDNSVDPQTALVLTNAGFSYPMGSPQNKAFNHTLKEKLDSEIFPETQSSSDPSLVFYPLSDDWEPPLKGMLRTRKIYNLFRKQFCFRPEKFALHTDWQNRIPAGFSLHPISQDLLDKFGADMFPWESPQAFLEKGFGFWLLAGDEIACECFSVFIGGGAAEINIHTEEKYQRHGLAYIAACAFITECLKRSLRPNWECWWDNESSASLAQKLGFEPLGDHPVFLVELNL
jgi:RimJ/RimL family protein N-acetyltransferase